MRKLLAWIDRRRYIRRARYLHLWIDLFGLDFAAAHALRRGWIEREAWEHDRRLKLVSARWFR